MAGILALAPAVCCAQTPLGMAPAQLVREVVYNELNDHERHGYWRYSIEKRLQQETRLEEQVETADGPVTRLVLSNGRPLSAADQQSEQARLDHLLNSPVDKSRLRQEHAEDERRIGRILALLPDAFRFDYAGEENGCHHLRFYPNPGYRAHSVEARVFHSMRGEMWIDTRMKRLARLEGHLEDNVDFGFGVLGRLDKGGWFRLQRIQVSTTDWKTERLEVHLSGRAMLFKTIARETSEARGGFAAVPPRLSLAQGVDLLRPLTTTASVTRDAFAARNEMSRTKH
jgi:hypothetical protein